MPDPHDAPLSFENALALQAHAIAQAKKTKNAIAVAVVDAGGHLISFARMEGVGFAAVDVVIGKARTAASFNMPTQILAAIALQKPGILSTGAIALDGGAPIIAHGTLLGAIAIGGLAPEEDHELAVSVIAQFTT